MKSDDSATPSAESRDDVIVLCRVEWITPMPPFWGSESDLTSFSSNGRKALEEVSPEAVRPAPRSIAPPTTLETDVTSITLASAAAHNSAAARRPAVALPMVLSSVGWVKFSLVVQLTASPRRPQAAQASSRALVMEPKGAAYQRSSSLCGASGHG